MGTVTTPILRARLGRAALASGSSEIVIRSLAIILSVASARMLFPGEVGVLGLAVTIVGLTSMLAVFAETAGVVTEGAASHRRYATVATALRAGVIAIVLPLLLVGLPNLSISLGGGEGRAADLCRLVHILSWQLAIEIVATYPRVIIQRTLDLTFLAITNLFGSVLNAALGILALLHGDRAAGMAIASVAAAAVVAIVLWIRILRRESPRTDGQGTMDAWAGVLRNALKMAPGGFTGYLTQRLDNLLVSSAVGPSVMSFYSMAWNTSRVASTVIGQSLQSVMIPAVARMQSQPGVIERGTREALRHAYLLLSPASAALLVVAPDIVEVVLGSKWLPMVPGLRIMCVTALASPMIGVSSALLVGLGRAHLTTFAAGSQLLVLVGMMIPLASRWGVVGAAFADLLGVAALTAVMCGLTRGHLVSLARMGAEAAAAPLIASLIAGLAAWGLGSRVDVQWARLAIELAAVALFYLLGVLTLGGRAQLTEVRHLVAKSLWDRPAPAEAN